MISFSFFKKIPTFFIGALTLCFFVKTLFTSSVNPNFFIWSWLRISLLFLLILLLLYFIFSLFIKPSLVRINNYIFYLVGILLFLFEVALRVKPSLVFTHMIDGFPHCIQRKIFEAKGVSRGPTLQIDPENKLFYRLKPFQKVPSYPYLKIDENGYRNYGVKYDKAKVIILGDSTILVADSKKDFGELFREKGVSALNFGMGGYSPQHYLETYKKFVVNKIQHQFVFIFLFVTNDFSDAYRYHKLKENGGDAEDYLDVRFSEKTATLTCSRLPWVLYFMKEMPGQILYFSRLGKIKLQEKQIKLPYKNIPLPEYLWWPPEINPESEEWHLVRETLREVIQLSKTQKVTPVIFLTPSPATVYFPFMPEFKEWEERHNRIAQLISDFSQREKVQFVDLKSSFQNAIRESFIYAYDEDCHLNSWGAERIFKDIFKKVSIRK